MKYIRNRPAPPRRHQRGTAISFIVIVAVVVTGIVMTLAWSAGLEAQAAANRIQSDTAFYAADGAIQWALENFRTNPSWPASNLPKTVSVNGWSVAVSYTDMGPSIGMATGVLGNPLKFKAVASKPGSTLGATDIATASGVLAYAPQFWTLQDLAIAQSARVNGDVEVMGNLTVNPPSSGNPVPKGAKGKVLTRGSVTDNNPAGSATYFSSAPVGGVSSLTSPSMKAADVFKTLKNGPTISIYNVLTYDSSGNPIIDFSKAGGKPVYISAVTYSGNVGVKSSSNPQNDTLIIDGNVTYSGTYPNNAPYAQMNLVVNGNATFNGTGSKGIAITGSFYVVGKWDQEGVYSFKGSIMCDSSALLNGTGLVDTSTPPTYDPRYIPKITSYQGNLP